MTKLVRSLVVSAAAVCLAGSMGFAQSGGEATYNTSCKACHGATGTPSAGMANMGVKAASSPEMKKLTVEQMIASVKDGKGKMMKAYGTKLTDAQIKDVVVYFRGLK